MEQSVSRARGRPKDLGKRDAILVAARELFLRHGADGVSLDVVIRASGVSKATFYANFADRAALLEAIISRESKRIVPETGVFSDNGALPDDLVAFGIRLLSFLTHVDMVGFERLIASAARESSDLAERFFEAGPGRSRRTLAARISRAVDAGELEVDDAKLAAEDLVGLWQGMMRVEMTMGLRTTPTAEALRARAERGVRLFIKLYAPTTSKAEKLL